MMGVGEGGLIKSNSPSAYWWTYGQDTMPSDTGDMTDEGLRAYEAALERASSETPKDRFTRARLLPRSAGSWMPDKSSSFYCADHPELIVAHMVNRVLVGVSSNSGQHLTTSNVVWYGVLESGVGWVVTKSGSLYHYVE